MGAGRAHRRRVARAAQAAHTDYGVMVGWCAHEGELPEVRQQLHDDLLRDMGERRTGGVRWMWWSGDPAAQRLAQMRALRTSEVGSPAFAAHLERIGHLLSERGGYLVAAMAPGRHG